MAMATDEGRDEIKKNANIQRAIKIEQFEANAPLHVTPIDFSRMTPDQFEAWQRQQEAMLSD